MICPQCGHENKEGAFYCSKCGNSFEENPPRRRIYKKKERGFKKEWEEVPFVEEEEDPLERKDRQVLTQVPGKFNWGALILTPFWGLGNRVYIGLLALIPGVHLLIALLAGFFGNTWAYRAGRYQDLQEFSRVQETWNRGGKLALVLEVILLFFLLAYAFYRRF